MRIKKLYYAGISVFVIMLAVNAVIILNNRSDYQAILTSNSELLKKQSAKDIHNVVHGALWQAYNQAAITPDSLKVALYREYPKPLTCPICKHDVVVTYHYDEFALDSTHTISLFNLDYDTTGTRRRMYSYNKDVEWICTYCYRDYYEDNYSLKEVR